MRPEDREHFERWGRDDEVRRHYGGRGTTSDPAALGLPTGERARPGASWLQAIETDTGEMIGWIELRDISWRRRSGELRVCLGAKALWGRGLGTAAVSAFLLQVTERWAMDEVYLRVAVWNRRAIRAYEKCGFRRAGILLAGRRRRQGMEDLLLMTLRARPEGGGVPAVPAMAPVPPLPPLPPVLTEPAL